MNARSLTNTSKSSHNEPMYASTWVALFWLLRHELKTPRTSRTEIGD